MSPPTPRRSAYIGHVVYLLGEYVFGYMVIAGCRHYALGSRRRGDRDVWLLVPARPGVSGCRVVAGGNVNVLFAVHALVYPVPVLQRAAGARRRHGPSPHAKVGLGVMKLALLLLTIDYLHYAPLFAAASYQDIDLSTRI